MKKIKYTEFTISFYPGLSIYNNDEFVLFGHFKEGHNLNYKEIGTFTDRNTAIFIKRLLTATLIKKGK